MQDPDALDETDLEIVNALQVVPRASWTELGSVLDLDPTTLARRWHRLVDEGISRITAFPRQPGAYGKQTALIEVRCHTGAETDVAMAVAEHAKTLSVEITTGEYQVLLTVLGEPRLADYVLDYLSGIPGVLGYRTHVLIDIPYEAHRWHVRALTPAQHRGLRALTTATGGSEQAPGGRMSELDQAVLSCLCVNGRIPYADIARAAGTSSSSAARAVNRVLRSGVIGLRCDIARPFLGWPFAAMLWATGDPRQGAARRPDSPERIPELRLCARTAGPDNVLLVVWLHTMADLPRVERLLGEEIPDLRISDRTIVLRPVKLMGHMFDANERYARTVPIY